MLAPAWKVVESLREARPEEGRRRDHGGRPALFSHEWTEHDPLTRGDGLGPVFNARSCVECHSQAAPGGGGPVEKNVTVYGLVTPDTHGIPPSGVVHQ